METDLFGFIPGGTQSQMNLTKSQKNVPVRVRYGRFENLRVVSGCKQTQFGTNNTQNVANLGDNW